MFAEPANRRPSVLRLSHVFEMTVRNPSALACDALTWAAVSLTMKVPIPFVGSCPLPASQVRESVSFSFSRTAVYVVGHAPARIFLATGSSSNLSSARVMGLPVWLLKTLQLVDEMAPSSD